MLKDGENLVTVEQLMKLETELRLALEELEPQWEEAAVQAKESRAAARESSVREPLAQESVTLGPEEAKDLLAKLEPLLLEGNTECMIYVNDLRAVAGSDELIEQIEDFDYESAGISLAELRITLGLM